jgi:hypothetical protein
MLRELGHGVTETTSSTKQSGVTFILQLHSAENLAYAEMQVANLGRFLERRFDYHPVLGPDPELKELGEKFVQSSKFSVECHSCLYKTLVECMEFTFQTIIPSLQLRDLVIHLNVDMFLLKPWDPYQYFHSLGDPDIVAVIEDHTTMPPYLHPGLLLMNASSAKKWSSMSFAMSDGERKGDVGAMTSHFLLQHPEMKVIPMVWSRHLILQDLAAQGHIDAVALDFVNSFIEVALTTDSPVDGRAPDFYSHDFSWFHVRDISCWSGADCKKRQLFLKDTLPKLLSKLQGRSHFTGAKPLNCTCCASTVTGHEPRCNSVGRFVASTLPAKNRTVKTSRVASASMETSSWLNELFAKSDELHQLIQHKKTSLTHKLSLPTSPAQRQNLELTPPRYTQELFQRDTSFYWRFVYDGTQDEDVSEVAQCKKRENQRYWISTYADGDTRDWIARFHTRPSCLLHGVDEVRIWGPADLDQEYIKRNSHILHETRGKGLWIWKHYVEYMTMREMNEGDILLYIDSDFRCDPSILQYFCLAQKHDVVGFHHSHPDYSLARLASRDSMILMGLDSVSISSSVQSSGGNIMFRKTANAINFVRETAAWSQQIDVVGNHGQPSKLGDDWAAYQSFGFNHQCDQAVSSLMLVKYGIKTFPWHLEGYGSGSDDELNHAQRLECGLNERAMSIHVGDDRGVSWIGKPDLRDVAQIACMEQFVDLQRNVEGKDSYEMNPWLHLSLSCIKSAISDVDREMTLELGMRMLEVPLLETKSDSCEFSFIHQDNMKDFKNVTTSCNATSSTSDSSTMTRNYENASTLVRIQCRGCTAPRLRDIKKHTSLDKFDYIEFEAGEGENTSEDLCEVYNLLSLSHVPIFQIAEGWERWVIRTSTRLYSLPVPASPLHE